MKKLLFAVVLGLLLVAALATTALADNGPHGAFTATTDACASCHRAHSAQYGSNSLLIMDPEALCMSCHNGSGAGTNVHDGVYAQGGADAYYGGGVSEGAAGASLFGGGFANALMATSWSGKVTYDATFDATSRPTTSAHDIGAIGTVWGSGAVGTPGTNGSMVLECTSCHDPHGTAGYVHNAATATKVASYRLLRFQPQGSNGFTAPATSVNWSGGAYPATVLAGTSTGWTVPDNFAVSGTEWYTLGTTSRFAIGDYNAGNANNVYNLKNAAAAEAATYIPAAVNTAFFCAQCHDRYFANSALRNAGDYSARCYGATTMPVYTSAAPFAAYNGINNPTALTDVSTIDAYCAPAASTSSTTGFVWGDNKDTGDSVYKYMHSSGDIRASMDGVRTAGAGTSVSRSCVACHVSHGTAAQMTAFADAASLATGSTLLRMDNRSICLRCHATTVNFVVGP